MPPPPLPRNREFAFTLMDVARLMKTYADQRARQFGISRARWGVLMKLQRVEGLKQSELAEMLDLQPITLTRLLDGLAANGLIERKPDPNDRRANRLYLTPAALPLIERLNKLGADMMAAVLDDIEPDTVEQMLHDLNNVRTNLRALISRGPAQQASNG
jgi:MarR family transcriptional regulator for hemolysin